MKILFGHALKGFVEWFTQNETEITALYTELDAANHFESLEMFAIELCLTMRGVDNIETSDTMES